MSMFRPRGVSGRHPIWVIVGHWTAPTSGVVRRFRAPWRPRIPPSRLPPPAAAIVSRRELFERLAGAARVTEVSAPAGSGKTFLLRSWIGAAGLADKAAWVAIPRGGVDPQGFWLTVMDSLRDTVIGSLVGAGVDRSAGSRRLVDRRATARRSASLEQPVWLVIDDLHELRSEDALRQLELLLMRAPDELRFLLATRHDLRLGLHRLRLEGGLTEIRASDLRFTVGRRARCSKRPEWSCPIRLCRAAGGTDRGVGRRFAAGGAFARRALRSRAVRCGVLRQRAHGRRVSAGRGARAPARGRQAAAASYVDPRSGQR